MFCTQCGQQIDDDSRFCRHCGAPQMPSAARSHAAASTGGSTAQTLPGQRKSSTGRGLLVALAILVLVVIAIANTKTVDSSSSTEVVNVTEPEAAAATSKGSGAKTDPTPASSWSYSTDEDKVRGKTSYFATVHSTNSIQQGMPYGSSGLSLTLRKSPAYGTDAIFRLDSGQLMCPSYEGCSGTISIDGGAPQRVQFNGSADNSSDTIFLQGAKSFIAKLKRAKKLVVEITVYQAGAPQFEFDVSGLKWEHS